MMTETTAKKYMAVYGTLKRTFGNHRLIEAAKLPFYAKASTKTPEFIITSSGIPFVHHPVPEEIGERIQVELYEFDSYDQITNIDNLEGHPNWYRRTPFEFITDSGETVTAEMYVMPIRDLNKVTLNNDRWNKAINRTEDGKLAGWYYDFSK